MRNNRNFATTQTLLGALLVICALIFYYFAVLRIDYQKTALLDLRPYPDATEYFAQAKALVKDRWPSIQIGYDKLPSRYPPGYPALMLPWLKILLEQHSVLAPFRTNQTIGLLLLLTVFTFYAYLAMPLTGGFVTLLLVTLPGFFTFCRSSLSEISVSAVGVLAFMFAFLGLKEQRRGMIYLSAVLLGLSVNIRIQSLFFAPLLVAMALFPAEETPLRRLSHCGVAVIVFVLAASPLLVLNTIQFHSPLKTGYGFWIVWPPSLGKAPPDSLDSLPSPECHAVMERVCVAPVRLFRRQHVRYRHVLCPSVYSSDLCRVVLCPGGPVRPLCSFILSGLPRADAAFCGYGGTILPASLYTLCGSCYPAGDVGRAEPF